jgi:hypothetical protein
MRTPRRPVEPAQTTARPVLTIHIDVGQLIAAVRRHAQLTPKAARALRADFAKLFDATRIVAVSTAPTRKTKAVDAQSPN